MNAQPEPSDAALVARLLAHDFSAAPLLMARIAAAAEAAPEVAPMLRLLGAVTVWEAPEVQKNLDASDIEDMVQGFCAGGYPIWSERRQVPLIIPPGIVGGED